MRVVKVLSAIVALMGVVVLALVAAPAVYGQRSDRSDRRPSELTILAGGGGALGVSVRDLNPAETDKQKLQSGVVVDDVRANTAADKAGLKRGDVIVQFDGENVRSARQFSRLVRETAPGKTVKTTIVREGKRSEVAVTLDDRRAEVWPSGDFADRMRDLGREMGRLGDRLPPMAFDFDFDLAGGGRRLGVTVEPLTSQLAAFFGAKEGVLVASIAEGSAAEKAGLKAGDVISTINGDPVRSRSDLAKGLRDARADGDVTLGIVRDKKETTVKAKIEPRRLTRSRPA